MRLFCCEDEEKSLAADVEQVKTRIGHINDGLCSLSVGEQRSVSVCTASWRAHRNQSE